MMINSTMIIMKRKISLNLLIVTMMANTILTTSIMHIKIMKMMINTTETKKNIIELMIMINLVNILMVEEVIIKLINKEKGMILKITDTQGAVGELEGMMLSIDTEIRELTKKVKLKDMKIIALMSSSMDKNT